LKLVLFVVGVLVAVAVTGASAADFETDNGPCRETPGESLLLRCPNGFVGREYEVELESEEGSGCSPAYDYFVLADGTTLPPGLTMTRDGLISGVPTSAGFWRFWIHNHDLPFWEGGPGWCIRDDTSEREFSIYVDPVLEITTATVKGATIGQPYSETLTARRIVSVNPPTGSEATPKWSVQAGALPPGLALSEQGRLTGTPTSEGSYRFTVKAQDGNPVDVKEYALSVRQPVRVTSPFGPAQPPSSEVGLRLEKTFTATGGSGSFTWALASGALPAGVVLDPARGLIAGTPRAAGAFAFDVTATDSEGRVARSAAALTVAPRVAIRTLRLKPGKVARPYRARLVTVGGVQPLRWTVVSGRLPRGLRLSQNTGSITGTPRQRGSFRLTLAARDALGVTSRRTLRLVVSS
jgi:large repetitive protein